MKWLKRAERVKPNLKDGRISFDKALTLIELKRYKEALKEARELILKKYNLLPTIKRALDFKKIL